MKKILNNLIIILLVIFVIMIAAVFIINRNDDCEHALVHYNAVAATCTEDGSVEYWRCSECGKYFADEDASEEITTIVAPATGHSWNDGEVVTETTCTTSGITKYICTVCGETKTEEVAATGHSYNSNGTCTVCGTVAEGMNAWTQEETTYFTYNGKQYSDHVIYYVAGDSCYYFDNGEQVYLYTADDIADGLTAVGILDNSTGNFAMGYIMDDGGGLILLMNIVVVS